MEKKHWLFTTIVLFVVSVAVTGYRGEYGANHPLQLIVVKRILNPASYPSDALADTSFAYASVFWYVVAFLSRICDIRLVLALLFTLAKCLLIYSALQVGQAIFSRCVIATVACAVLVAVPSYQYTPGNLVQGTTEQTVFAVSFLFLSLAAFIKREWWKWGVYLGIVANLNFLYFMYGLSYYVAAWLALRRHECKQFITSTVIAVFESIPAVYLLLRAARQPVEDPTAAWMVAELTYPPYFFPNTIGVRWHAILGLFFILALTLPRFRNLPLSPVVARTLQVWAAVAMGWYGLAWATPLWIHSLPLLQMHLIRAVDLWYFSMGFLIAGLVASLVQAHAASSLQRRVLLGLALISATLWPYLLSSSWKFVGFVLTVTLVVGELVCLVSRRLPLSLGKMHPLSYYLVLISVGSVLVSAHAMRGRLQAFGDVLFVRYPTVETIAKWARHNTASDAVFLIPVHGEWRYFRYFSDRSVFVHQKDGDAWPYAPWYAAEWLRRMALLGLFEVAGIDPQRYRIGEWTFIGGSEWTRSPINYYEAVSKRITEAHVNRLKKYYKIDYWITYKDTKTSYSTVHTLGEWKIVKTISIK